jgi:hypothetical protein
MADIVNNINPTWEKLPSVARTLNFRLTTRDNQLPAGCTGEANMTVTTVATGNPFEVTAPTVSGLSFNGGSMQTVTWNVVGTTAAPISCANVDILLSTDGGLTYPTTILTATANDGTENITMPNITTTTARIMIRANGNIFFDISNNDFAITAVVLPIELISFKALPLDKSIRLNWKTASENNNRGFELQRRSDTESNFEKIAWIKGNGTTTRENSYTYSDEKVQPNKTYYYRLHQIDEDGKGTFSKVEVAALNKNGLWGMELQPNPAREQIGVTLFGNTNEVNRYRLVSINGQIVQEGTFLEKYNTLNINELPNGVYFIQVSNENNILTKKIIKD